MGCPVKDRINQQKADRPTEYPFEPLYRPWSWTLSSLSNVSLFATMFLVVYLLYRKRRQSKKGRTIVSYRRVEIKGEEEGRVSVLVTGSQGCVGRHLVDCLLRDGGYNVHCLDLYIPLEENRKGEVCSYIQTDIRNYDELLLSLRGKQAVFHTADITPQDGFLGKTDFRRVIVGGTENVIKGCRECSVKQLIYTSSAAVVMGKRWESKNADECTSYPETPLNVFLAGKTSAERLVLEANGGDGLFTCAMRLATTVCSRYNQNIKDLLAQRMFVVKDINYGMTIVSGEAAARGHILAEKNLRDGSASSAAGKAYNLGGKDRVLCHDFYGALTSDEETIWGQPPPYAIPLWALSLMAVANHCWYWLSGGKLTYRCLSRMFLDGFTVEQSISSERASRELGWEETLGWREMVEEVVREHRAGEEGKKRK